MRRLVKGLFMILLMQFLSAMPANGILLFSVAHATPAIKVINDTMSEETTRLAQFTIMGASIDREENITGSNGNKVCVAEGKVDPAANSLTINISGFNNSAAEAVITIKAFENVGCEGEGTSREERILKTKDGETLNISCKYNIMEKTKSIIVELKYNGIQKIYKLLVV